MTLFSTCFLVFLALADADSAKTDKERLQGTWTVLTIEIAGQKSSLTKDELQMVKLEIKGNRWIMRFPPGDVTGGARSEATITLDESTKPKSIDATIISEESSGKKSEENKGKKSLGIYSLDGDTLKMCFGATGESRPKRFNTKNGDEDSLMVLKRDKN